MIEHGDDATGIFGNPSPEKIAAGTVITAGTPAAETEPAIGETNNTEHGIHPLIPLLDLAVSLTTTISQKSGIEPPNQEIYQDVARDATNEVLWKFAPNFGGDGDENNPLILIPVTLIALGVVFLPTVISIIQKRAAERRAREAEESAQPPAYTPAEVPQMPTAANTPTEPNNDGVYIDEDDPTCVIAQLPLNPKTGIVGI